MLHVRAHDHLTEHGLETLGGVLNSTMSFVSAACSYLSGVWKERRAKPTIIAQPREQWKEVKTSSRPFDGYAEGTLGTGFKQLHVSLSAVRRIRAAALTTELRHLWDTFD